MYCNRTGIALGKFELSSDEFIGADFLLMSILPQSPVQHIIKSLYPSIKQLNAIVFQMGYVMQNSATPASALYFLTR